MLRYETGQTKSGSFATLEDDKIGFEGGMVGKQQRSDERAGSLGTVVITGASRGIGAATARLAAARGYAIGVNYARGSAEAAAVVREIREAGAEAIQANIALEADVVRLFAEAERALGPLTGLVNNAGITGGFARVDAITAEALERLMAVNVTGSILCAREAVRRMSTRHGGTGGAIVNISSIAAKDGSGG